MNIQLKEGRKIIQLPASEIIFIQSSNIYCLVYLKNGQKIVCTSTLKDLKKKLEVCNFIQTHRCYIVNLEEIRILDKSSLSLFMYHCEQVIPIARSTIKAVLNKLS